AKKKSLIFDLPEIGPTDIVSLGKKNAIVKKDGKDQKYAIEKLGVHGYHTKGLKFCLECKDLFYLLQTQITGQPIPFQKIAGLNNVQKGIIKRLNRYLKSHLDISAKQATLLYDIIYNDIYSTKEIVSGEEADSWISVCYGLIKEFNILKRENNIIGMSISFLQKMIDYHRQNQYLTVPQVNTLKKIKYEYTRDKLNKSTGINGKLFIKDIKLEHKAIVMFLLYRLDLPDIIRESLLSIAEMKRFLLIFSPTPGTLLPKTLKYLEKEYFDKNNIPKRKDLLNSFYAWLEYLDLEKIIKEETNNV
ncbi:hypothetical protein ACFL5G_05825, partial [Candidatus Margulisiibacteriota bacterium]